MKTDIRHLMHGITAIVRDFAWCTWGQKGEGHTSEIVISIYKCINMCVQIIRDDPFNFNGIMAKE